MEQFQDKQREVERRFQGLRRETTPPPPPEPQPGGQSYFAIYPSGSLYEKSSAEQPVRCCLSRYTSAQCLPPDDSEPSLDSLRDFPCPLLVYRHPLASTLSESLWFHYRYQSGRILRSHQRGNLFPHRRSWPRWIITSLRVSVSLEDQHGQRTRILRACTYPASPICTPARLPPS